MDYRKILILILVIGCNEVKDCDLDENRQSALVLFNRISDNTRIDTLIFNQDTLIGGILFPLDPVNDMTSFTLETDSIVYDLSFTYKKEFSVFDLKCDPSIKFFDLTCTSEVFDSVAVVNPILNREELINVEVYF